MSATTGWQPDKPYNDLPRLPPVIELETKPLLHRLAEHIEWAAGRGALESITVFLRGLREDEWFHLGD